MRVYDYLCQNGHKTEHFIGACDDMERQTCPECGEIATRCIPAPRSQLEGISGAFPTAADKWEQRRESHMRKERRNMDNHGTYD